MSRLDYRYKEICYDPSVLEAIFPAPVPKDNGEEDERRKERARFVRSKMREVRKAMAWSLTTRQNECLTLYYLHGQPQREIAARLGIHQTTVSQHVQYALKKLRRVCCA
ncbi:MAG: sigma-70 family RNA polymerase sigma factor [Rhodopirellula sp.]|nr:sigma-70 family RNA polymerase sigma factor [Rhodopirellula sp.]